MTKTAPPLILRLLPLLVLGLCAWYLHARWDDIPERYPCHWSGLRSQADSWTTRTASGVYGPLVMAALIVGFLESLMALSMWGVTSPRYSRVPAKAVGLVKGIRWFMLMIEYLLVANFAIMSVCVPLFTQSGRLPAPVAILPILTVLLSTFSVPLLLVWLLRQKEQAAPSDPGPESDDKYWKWGVIYRNPDDLALWVPKRMGLGWTTNMAHPKAWPLLGGVLLLTLVFMLSIALASHYLG